jgi:hypothetical protein
MPLRFRFGDDLRQLLSSQCTRQGPELEFPAGYDNGENYNPGGYPYVNGSTVPNVVAMARGYKTCGDSQGILVKHVNDPSAWE